VKARRAGEVPDLLLLLQHPHVLTVGAGARHSHGNIVADSATLQAKGIQVVEVGRGGDVTYHGPGQLVGYPIVDLRPDRCDVRRYMRDLEEVMIRTAGTFGVTAERVSGLTGVWVGNAKLGAIGVRISKWITSHGFAFNVMTDLEYFNLIVPCGIKDRPATSLSALLGRMVSVTEVEQVLTEHFSVVFDRSVI
jgi:lipoate-protein ligase B